MITTLMHDLKRIVQAILMAIATILGLACAHGPRTETVRPGGGAKPVAFIWDFANEVSWMRSGYWRMSDEPGRWPWFAVVSSDGTACPAWEHEVAVPKKADFYKCKTTWRPNRPI